MTPTILLLAAALLTGAGPAVARQRAHGRYHRPLPEPPKSDSDPLAMAAGLDVFGLCLTAGMTIAGAAVATAGSAPSALAAVLRRSAGLLSLGADPTIAWSADPHGPPDAQIQALLRLARRSGSSGTALAAGVAELSAQCRSDAENTTTAAGERAAVLIAGPLAGCFLPAFVCLGLVPVVAGLAGRVMGNGLL